MKYHPDVANTEDNAEKFRAVKDAYDLALKLRSDGTTWDEYYATETLRQEEVAEARQHYMEYASRTIPKEVGVARRNATLGVLFVFAPVYFAVGVAFAALWKHHVLREAPTANPYELLGVPEDTALPGVKQAYHQLALGI